MSENVFLPGWEYNRVLGGALERRNSALPGDLLWHGSYQLWMFRNVYCTEDALENEKSAGKTLGWVSGRVFKDLEDAGILKPIKWTDLRSETKSKLRDSHAKAQETYGASVRGWIDQNNASALEAVRLKVLTPILKEKGADMGYAPSSLKAWKDTPPATAGLILAQQLIREIAKPIMVRTPGTRALFIAGLG